VDGMSLDRIGRVINAVRHERYRFSPARRVYIPKRNGKPRPLGRGISKSVCAGSGRDDRKDQATVSGDPLDGAGDLGDPSQA
jgi:hypothetical protein